ncbi:MAG: YbaK/EbsC family protein [Chloroflexota bacterium]|nr:YbaK/EbsC family protein [Chloroflexota bacterium]
MGSVEDLHAYLSAAGLAIQQLPDNTSTAPLAAQALHTAVGTIVKSLLFYADDEPLLVLVAGDRKVNRARLASERNVARVRLASPEEVIAATGYAVGGVPPVAHLGPITTLIDRRLLDHETVYAAAGSAHVIFAVPSSRLVELTHGEFTDATE